jgi:hypothetical protein
MRLQENHFTVNMDESMRFQCRSLLAAACLSFSLFTTPGYAALESRLNGNAVYDTDLNVTWATKASNYNTWFALESWIAGLTIAGVSGWRLPSTDTSCSQFNCTGSEMGHLFYNELAGVAGDNLATTHNANYSLFSNLASGSFWTDATYAPNTADAWYFSTSNGIQAHDHKDFNAYGLAVRSGDVAATIPEPEAHAMMLAGLGLLGFFARRRKQQAA